MDNLDTERKLKIIKGKLSGLRLSDEQKTELAKEINQLAITITDMYKTRKVKQL